METVLAHFCLLLDDEVAVVFLCRGVGAVVAKWGLMISSVPPLFLLSPAALDDSVQILTRLASVSCNCCWCNYSEKRDLLKLT